MSTSLRASSETSSTRSIQSKTQNTIQGVGLGLRAPHYQHILSHQPAVPWFEVLSDNYLGEGGQPLAYLERIRQDYAIALHGVGMSLGSADPLNLDYLKRLKRLADRIEPTHISDHLAWISINGRYLNDLAPLPYTEALLAHVAQRIEQVQDFLGQQILIENPTPYVRFTGSTLSEWQFIRALLEQADCYLLLDVNNVYVSAINHGFDPLDYLDGLPTTRVKEIHLAGYEEREDYLFDTHGYPVHPPVWELYQEALKRFGPVPTLIEWDTDIPAIETVLQEAYKADEIKQSILNVHKDSVHA